jgi:hypothetical protein
MVDTSVDAAVLQVKVGIYIDNGVVANLYA